MFEDTGFTSTSLSKDVAKQFAGKGMNVMDAEKISHLIEYHAPKGTKAGYVEGLSSTPEEFAGRNIVSVILWTRKNLVVVP